MIFFPILVFLNLFFVYHSWFGIQNTLSSGDFPYLFVENIKGFSFWAQKENLWLAPYYQISAKLFVQYLNVPWEITEKIFWFWPFILLSIASSFYLTKSWLGVLIYTTNTYILMLVGGGQMGVGLAYSIAPFVLAKFIEFIDDFHNAILRPKAEESHKILRFAQDDNAMRIVVAGLVLGIQVMFDPRIAYISIIAVMLYFVSSIKYQVSCGNIRATYYLLLTTFLIPVALVLLLNSYWIIPLLQTGFPAEVKNYTSSAGFQFLSFADFPHALSLLHPNWPENIFGKIYFLKPEFLLLPILAFSSLLFVGKNSYIATWLHGSKNKLAMQQFSHATIPFFALLGLIGAFLAKGANSPFGEINSFLFQYFPGMSMFRDSTKWYILVVLSYSILIPFSLEKISEKVSSIKYQVLSIRFKLHNTYYIILTTFLIFWLILIRPAVFGQLGGTFKPQVLPQEYVQLKDFLQNQPQSFKTFWIPSRQRFGFYSTVHPAISAQDYFQTNNLEEILTIVKKLDFKKQLENLSVKYVLVPYDSQEELFLTDRKFDESKYEEMIKMLKSLPYLKLIDNFGRIAVFEVKPEK